MHHDPLLPDAGQRLLLRACLQDQPDAGQAWTAWEQSRDFDLISYGAQRLIPQLHANLRRLGIQARDAARMSGLQRYHWSANQLRVRRLAAPIQRLSAAAIPVMLVSGLGVAKACYEHVGLRPLARVALLVPTASADRALGCLEEVGYTRPPAARLPRQNGKLAVARSAAAELVGPAGDTLRLHWHLLQDCLAEHGDEPFWRRARPTALQGLPVLLPSPADLLLQTAVDEPTRPAWAPGPWLADIARLLDDAAFEPETLTAAARRRLLVLPLAAALQSLQRVVPSGRAQALLDQLDPGGQPWAAQREWAHRLERQRYQATLSGLWCAWLRHTPGGSWPQRVRSLPSFLCDAWDVEPAQLPRAALLRVLPYLARKVGARRR